MCLKFSFQCSMRIRVERPWGFLMPASPRPSRFPFKMPAPARPVKQIGKTMPTHPRAVRAARGHELKRNAESIMHISGRKNLFCLPKIYYKTITISSHECTWDLQGLRHSTGLYGDRDTSYRCTSCNQLKNPFIAGWRSWDSKERIHEAKFGIFGKFVTWHQKFIPLLTRVLIRERGLKSLLNLL